MIPKVKFINSPIYTTNICAARNLLFDFKSDSKTIDDFIKKLEKTWQPIEKKVLAEAAKITGLHWKRREIYCYVTKYNVFVPFSDPLTIGIINPANKKLNTVEYIDILVHELLHNLFIDDWKRYIGPVSKLVEKHSNEPAKTKRHVFLQAVHEHLYLRFFGKARLNYDVMDSKTRRPPYYRAWQIVEQEGYKNIIAEFRKYLKGK